MVPIPERPDEFVFLLGVVKPYVYGAPWNGALSRGTISKQTTRSDFTGRYLLIFSFTAPQFSPFPNRTIITTLTFPGHSNLYPV